MTQPMFAGRAHRPIRIRAALAVAALVAVQSPAWAQYGGIQFQPGPTGAPLWADQAAGYAQQMRMLFGFGSGVGATIPAYQSFPDAAGVTSTDQPGGSTSTAGNPFFQSFGNGRTCTSCHAPAAGWSLTPPQIQALFYLSGGTNTLFEPVDGANCPSANTSSFQASLGAYSLLLNQGLIRIFEKVAPLPDLQYQITAITDPYSCSTNATTGLTAYGPGVTPAGFLSVYRRPLASTNLGVLSTILSDGRETTLNQQAIDANRIHAQATTLLTAAQAQQIVTFESGLYSAQTYGNLAGDLTSNGATGGPVAFSQQPFAIGENDPFGANPTGAAFNPNVFTLFTAWQQTGGGGWTNGYNNNGWNNGGYGGYGGYSETPSASIAHGETLFNTQQFTISGVAGVNDVLGEPSITGTCTTCHDATNAGTHSVNLLMDTGAAAPGAPGLNLSALPVFTLQCVAGPLAGQSFTTTDPGRAILSGQCADIGRVKVLTLRNLAVRPPYFHNGSAPTLNAVVGFYNTRFNIGLTAQDQSDLVAFLNSI